MIEAYEIGIRLALDDGVSAGVEAMKRELADLDRLVNSSTAKLATLRDAAAAAAGPLAPEPQQTRRLEPTASAEADENFHARTILPAPAAATGLAAPSYEVETEQPSDAPVAPPEKPVPAPEGGERQASAPITSPTTDRSEPASAARAADDRRSAPASAPAPPAPPAAAPAALEPKPAERIIPRQSGAPTVRDRMVVVRQAARAAAAPRSELRPVDLAPPLPHPRSAAPEPQVRALPPVAAEVSTTQVWRLTDISTSPAAPAPRNAPTARPAAIAATAPRAAAPAAANGPPRAAATPTAPDKQPMNVHVYLDGAPLGRWMEEHLGRAASRPPASTTSFDPRVGPAWPGASIA